MYRPPVFTKREEARKIVAVTIISGILFGIGVAFQCFEFALLPGLVFFPCCWSCFGMVLGNLGYNRRQEELEHFDAQRWVDSWNNTFKIDLD